MQSTPGTRHTLSERSEFVHCRSRRTAQGQKEPRHEQNGVGHLCRNKIDAAADPNADIICQRKVI